MSGIYIKGLGMPTDCINCQFEAFGTCMVNAKDVEEFEYTHSKITKDPDCPLVPVPPHGRLIDADALEKDIDNYIGGEESRSRFHHWVQVQSVVIPGNKGEEK